MKDLARLVGIRNRKNVCEQIIKIVVELEA